MRTSKKQIAKYKEIMNNLGWRVYAKGESLVNNAVAVSKTGEIRYFKTNNELFDFICDVMFA